MGGMAQPADRTVHALLQSLFQNGVRHFVITPGSRNTPITIAATDGNSSSSSSANRSGTNCASKSH